jgi:hypothetical protein
MSETRFGPIPSRRLLVVCALAITLLALLLPPQNAKAQAQGGLDVIGELPMPWYKDADPNFFRMIGIDREKQILYSTFQVVDGGNKRFIVEHDLSKPIPTPLRISEPNVTVSTFQSPYSVAFDRGRDRMLLLSNTLGRNLIEIVDLDTLTQVAKWEFETILPGFAPVGMRYDEKTDRFLLVGEFSGSRETGGAPRNTGNYLAGPGPAVVALEGGSGAVVWVSPLQQCHSVMVAFGAGALLAQSIYRPSLYAFCSSGEAARQPAAGQNGLVRLDITGHEKAAGVVNFPSEFFPVSGTYTGTSGSTGITGFDPKSERFYAQSLAARTPGTWVFDGLRDSWVGFIAAPNATNKFLGLDSETGKHYMGGSGGAISYINVTDGRATPVPQGTLFEDIPIAEQILTDPDSDRLFAPMAVESPEGGSRWGVMVLRDKTPPIVPLSPTNYDALTQDLPDSKSVVQYSAAASGFGAGYTVVGGWESLYSRYTHPINPNEDNPAGPNPAELAYGDRGITYSAVPSVDIRPSGASATAAAGAVDQATDSDRRDRESQVPERPEEAPKPPKPPKEARVSTLAGGQTCLNGGGPRIENEQGKGDPERVVVVCDLAELTAEGFASYTDNINGGGQSLGASSFDTRTFLDPKRGVVTETTAVARGLTLGAPGGQGSVSFDRVTAVATTIANGRPGTAKSTWQRTVEGAVITDPDGKEQRPRSCTTTVTAGAKPRTEGDCGTLENAINSVTTRMQVRFPAPVLTATSRGAYARIEERETDFLNGLTLNNDQSRAVPAMEVTIYNDGPEKGRLIAQYAAIDANSIFTRSPMATFGEIDRPRTGWDDQGPTDTGADDEDGPTGGTPGTPGRWVEGDPGTAAAGDLGLGGDTAAQPDVADGYDGLVGTSPTGAGQPVLGWMIGARSPRDAALAAGIWLLFAGALTSVWRRRRLIETAGE